VRLDAARAAVGGVAWGRRTAPRGVIALPAESRRAPSRQVVVRSNSSMRVVWRRRQVTERPAIDASGGTAHSAQVEGSLGQFALGRSHGLALTGVTLLHRRKVGFGGSVSDARRGRVGGSLGSGSSRFGRGPCHPWHRLVGGSPIAISTWWSVVTPMIAILALAIGRKPRVGTPRCAAGGHCARGAAQLRAAARAHRRASREASGKWTKLPDAPRDALGCASTKDARDARAAPMLAVRGRATQDERLAALRSVRWGEPRFAPPGR
jgi:hypothetical protein